jgi:hypothetical protein
MKNRKNRALAMPEYVAQLITLSLVRMGLTPDAEDDLITCSLIYEDGTELSLVTMCIAERGWFRERPMLVVSIVTLANDTRPIQVHAQGTMPVPTGPNDFPFLVRLSAKVRAAAWSLAATSRMGECVSLPGRTSFNPKM